MKTLEYPEDKNFSIILGGPFFQLLRKAHLTNDTMNLMVKRLLILTAIAWLPLFILSLIQGVAWGAKADLTFIEDIEIHVRFLVALPVLIFAEMMVHERIMLMVHQFHLRNLIPAEAEKRFTDSIDTAFRWRNSYVSEIIIVAIIYFVGYRLLWAQAAEVNTVAWHTEPAIGDGRLSMAGLWFRYVSLPFFQFLLLRWYYRIFIWMRFLIQVSRINLQLIPSHPDSLGGLGFLSNNIVAFVPLAIAHGCIVAGTIANHIFHSEATLLDFKIHLVILVVWVLILVIAPLVPFSLRLMDLKRNSTLAYGKLASDYARAFERRWLNTQKSNDEILAGSTDIQGLSNQVTTYKVVENLRAIPITRNDIILLVVLTLAPVLPLVLTMMPLADIIKVLMGVAF